VFRVFVRFVVNMRSSRVVAVALVTFATFTDIVAYSIAVPVLPDLSRRLGASPTMIGFLFASFGVTLLTVSMPMGAVSDRIGRRLPLVGGLIVLALASLLFAFGSGLPWLFAARLTQGAADAITWVVGFALIADLYPSTSRGRITGIVMMGTSFAFMIGPSLGGWLYELGGMRLPFIAVAVMAAVGAAAFLWLDIPTRHTDHDPVPMRLVVRVPAIALCGLAVLAISSTISMLEPVNALHLGEFGLNPARIGMVYGVAAVVTTLLHPIYGHAADRWGARRMTMVGLALSGVVMPLVSRSWNFESAVALFVLQASVAAMAITPSLAFMGEATSQAGVQSFGVAYGLYNLAWGAGLLSGPAAGGFLYERIGFTPLTFLWGPLLVIVALLLARVRSAPEDRMRSVVTLIAVGLLCCTVAVRADVRSDEKSHLEFAGTLGKIVNIFGGKAAREGVTSTVAVKGDRKATLSDATGQIVDLGEEKIYDLDMKKKTVKVTTFAELRRRMEEAQKKAQEDAKKEQPQSQPSAKPADEKQMEIDFDVKNTGQKKTINGFDTHEVVMTITVREKGKTLEQSGGLVLTSDMWMAPRIAAMKEIADFDRRYFEKLYGPMISGASPEQMASALALYPMLKPAIGRMNTEGAKLDGTAIQTTTTVDAVKSADQMAEEQKQRDADTKSSATGGVGGLVGGFAKRMAQKKVNGDDNKARATFMTMTSEVLKVVTDVSAADVAVPAGFKESR
jgi:MFS transporter, DHA1 family, solute carrier family 18 (vesicular amine transporter), member 1/2